MGFTSVSRRCCHRLNGSVPSILRRSRHEADLHVRIEDYGLIGDTQTAALVGIDGSIDWLCMPRFDSPACFAALVGDRSHGRWQIAPASPILSTSRRYRDRSLVLETEFTTETGTARLVDCMPPRQNDPDLVRIVEGVRGEVRMQMELVIRFDYGSIVPWVRNVDGALRAIGGPDALSLWTPVDTRGVDLTTRAEFTVKQGERVPFVMVWHPSHLTPQPIDAFVAVEETSEWWKAWAERCTYDGQWREEVLRSLIVLKALTFAPTGGILAAPTTSLPERIGGVRNWDYRYCWLRDATFTLYALKIGGYTDESVAWRNWLVRAVAGDPADFRSCMDLPASVGSWRWNCHGCPVQGIEAGAHRQCGVGPAAARRLRRGDGRAAARAALRSGDRQAVVGAAARIDEGRSSASGRSPTRAYGRCAARGAISRIRR